MLIGDLLLLSNTNVLKNWSISAASGVISEIYAITFLFMPYLAGDWHKNVQYKDQTGSDTLWKI